MHLAGQPALLTVLTCSLRLAPNPLWSAWRSLFIRGRERFRMRARSKQSQLYYEEVLGMIPIETSLQEFGRFRDEDYR